MKKKQQELFSLMSARHDGLSDEESNRRLAQLLEGDAEAQRYYLELGSMFHELEETFHGHCAETLVDEFPGRRSTVVPLLTWSLAIAASLVVAFLMVPRSGNSRSVLLVDTDSTVLMKDECSYVAHIVKSDGVEWGPANTVEIESSTLKPGMLDLKKGSLDVVLDNGVRFGFTAPVRMDLSSLQRLFLHSGYLVMDVPGLAEGLVVNTPDAAFKINTAFAHVHCTDTRATFVKVDRGALELFTEDDAGREVRRNIVGDEAIEIARGTIDPVLTTQRAKEPRMDLPVPMKLENLHYVHYSFDDIQHGVVKNQGTIPNADGRLEGVAAHPEYPLPRRVAGRFGRALKFSGHDEGMIADIKEFESDEPGSVAFWIKMDPGMVPNKYENIFTWHMYRFPHKEWHDDDEKELACRIRVNESAAEGVVGAVRVEFRDHWICGTTDLRDGRWHHVTAVFHRSFESTTVRHYIDGKLARSSARGRTWFPKERFAEVGGGSIAVGRVYWPERPEELAASDPVGLRGMVDELYVFNQAVLPSHASSLYIKNTPNQVLDISFVPYFKAPVGMLMLPGSGK